MVFLALGSIHKPLDNSMLASHSISIWVNPLRGSLYHLSWVSGSETGGIYI